MQWIGMSEFDQMPGGLAYEVSCITHSNSSLSSIFILFLLPVIWINETVLYNFKTNNRISYKIEVYFSYFPPKQGLFNENKKYCSCSFYLPTNIYFYYEQQSSILVGLRTVQMIRMIEWHLGTTLVYIVWICLTVLSKR